MREGRAGTQRPGGKKKAPALQIGALSVPLVPLPAQINMSALASLMGQKSAPESDLYYDEQRTAVAKLDASFRDATRAADRVRKAHGGTTWEDDRAPAHVQRRARRSRLPGR